MKALTILSGNLSSHKCNFDFLLKLENILYYLPTTNLICFITEAGLEKVIKLNSSFEELIGQKKEFMMINKKLIVNTNLIRSVKEDEEDSEYTLRTKNHKLLSVKIHTKTEDQQRIPVK